MNLPAKSYIPNSAGTLLDEPAVTYAGGLNDEYLTPARQPHFTTT